jgi:hypothetical protein
MQTAIILFAQRASIWMVAMTSPHRVIQAEFEWAIAAAPAPELICDLAIGTVPGAGGR